MEITDGAKSCGEELLPTALKKTVPASYAEWAEFSTAQSFLHTSETSLPLTQGFCQVALRRGESSTGTLK